MKTLRNGSKVYLERRSGMGGQASNISSEIGDYRIIPIVVFSDRADLKITTPNHIVINRCNPRNVIRQFNAPVGTTSKNRILPHFPKHQFINHNEIDKSGEHSCE